MGSEMCIRDRDGTGTLLGGNLLHKERFAGECFSHQSAQHPPASLPFQFQRRAHARHGAGLGMNHVPLGEVNAEEWVGGAFENESCHKEKGTDFF